MSGPWEHYAAQRPAAASAGPWTQYAAPAAQPVTQQAGAGSVARDLLAGAVRGAGSIGATILAPVDMISDAVDGKGLSLASNRKRRADMDAALRDQFGVDTDSGSFAAGKLGAEVVGTLGVGGVLAPVARALGASPAVVEAIATAGMKTGAAPTTLGAKAADLALRSAGGAVNAGASAALVDPNADAIKTGAAVGAAMPPVLRGGAAVVKATGKGLGLGATELRQMFQAEPVRAAQELMKALDLTPEQLPGVIATLKGARSGVEGVTPTVAQTLTSPQSAILERVVSAGPGGEKLRLALQAQAEARASALRGVVPGAAGKTEIAAAENLGRTAAAEGAEVKGWLKDARNQQYNSEALQRATLVMPGKTAGRDAVETFYPGTAFDEAPADLRRLVSRLDSGAPVPFQEFDALRKIAGNRARDLSDSDRTAAAAWGRLKGLFDEAENLALAKSGRLKPTGQGPFGPVFGGLSGDPENAVAHLLQTGAGSVPDAATHPMLGGIELVARTPGKKSLGLQHIAERGRDDVLRDLPALLQDGAPYSRLPKRMSDGRMYLGHGGNEAPVRLEWDNTARQWVPTAYPVWLERGVQPEASRAANEAGLTLRTNSPQQQAGGGTLPDIEASFQRFSDALNPPPPLRDPRQYTGDLAGALSPEAAQAASTGRAIHRDMTQRFSGPWVYAERTGADGLPMAQGAELGRRFVNGGASQLADLQALKAGVLERGPTMEAARQYALADLLDVAVNRDTGLLRSGALARAVDNRQLMLRELLTPEQLARLDAVVADAGRATEAAGRARGPGSNTYQNAANALDAGLLDSAPVKAIAQRLPIAKHFLEPARAGMAAGAGESKGMRLAALLADPQAAAAVLAGQQRSATGQAAKHVMDWADAGLTGAIPGLDGLSLRDLLALAAYRAPPLAAAGASSSSSPR